MGNSGEARFKDQLASWAAAEDPILAEAANGAIQRIHSLETGRNSAGMVEDNVEDNQAGESTSRPQKTPAALLASE
jgi:hypothetical protein